MNTLSSERSKAELLRRLKTVRPDSARVWGRMTAHQMICHLTDSCLMATGERQVSDATGPLQRTVIKWIALYLPLPWPKGRVQTRPEVDQEGGGTCPSDFAHDVARLEAILERLAARPRAFQWSATHPIFGRMRESEWLRWAYLHADHHFRQFGL
jgi:uncharacterized protein DUF1569